MRIDRTLAEARQAEIVQQRNTAGRSEPGTPLEPVSAASKVDRVEISDAGRAMAMREELPTEGGELSPERIAALRERIRAGAFNDPAIAEAVARRMLASGDA